MPVMVAVMMVVMAVLRRYLRAPNTVRFLNVRVQINDQISDAQLPLVVVIVEVSGSASVVGSGCCCARCGGWGTFQFALEADRAIPRDPSGVPRGVG